jgi:hypothetical protein
MSQQFDSAAYHEAGHITAAVVQAMPLREKGVHVDLDGNGKAFYFEKLTADSGMTESDHRERKVSIISIYAAHMAQLKFYPACEQSGWREDTQKIRAFARWISQNDIEQQQLEEDLRARAKKLVDVHWPMIEEFAQTLLAKPCTPMSQEDYRWGTGGFKRHMPGAEIVEFFARRGIHTKVVGDDVLNYDSTHDIPHYDSLAPPDL